MHDIEALVHDIEIRWDSAGLTPAVIEDPQLLLKAMGSMNLDQWQSVFRDMAELLLALHGTPEDDVDTAIWVAEHEIEQDEHMYEVDRDEHTYDGSESFASKMGHPGGHYG
jgi:hypothetical protein